MSITRQKGEIQPDRFNCSGEPSMTITQRYKGEKKSVDAEGALKTPLQTGQGPMTLSIAEVEVNDLPIITDIWFTAFSTINPIERLIYPLSPTPSITTSSLALEKREFLKPETRYFKIVDSDLANQEAQSKPGDNGRFEGLEGSGAGKTVVPDRGSSSSSIIIAFVRFKLWSKDRKVSDWDQPYRVSEGELGAIGDVNLDVARSFRGQQKQMSRTHIKGSKCICMYLSRQPFPPSFLPSFLPFAYI